MSARRVPRGPAMTTARAPGSPRKWLEAIADAHSVRALDGEIAAPRASPHLAQWSIAAQDDDGIDVASIAIAGRRVLAAAQDARFLGGAVGAGHARALECLFVAARASATPVLLLLASGGVRLHEANPAELALARALRALIDARAKGVSIVALAIGDVFGGASVLACATDALGMLPSARLGLSGPKVIATARGDAELDPADADGIEALFGAPARTRAGDADLVTSDVDGIRAWIAQRLYARPPLRDAIRESQERLAHRFVGERAAMLWRVPSAWQRRLAPVAPQTGVWRVKDRAAWVVGAPGEAVVTPEALHAVDRALMEHVLPEAAGRGIVVLAEDSRGHEVSRRAEEICLSRFLAHHAGVIGVLRGSGVNVRAALAGQGHSAAFFANALQADFLIAAQNATVMAMNPTAVARVTGLARDALLARIDTDPVLGHSARLFGH